MLASYTTVVRKEQLLTKMAEDSDMISRELESIITTLSMFSEAAESNNLVECSKNIEKFQELMKVFNIMAQNLHSNYNSYVSQVFAQDKATSPVVEDTTPARTEDKEFSITELSAVVEKISKLKQAQQSLDEKSKNI